MDIGTDLTKVLNMKPITQAIKRLLVQLVESVLLEKQTWVEDLKLVDIHQIDQIYDF